MAGFGGRWLGITSYSVQTGGFILTTGRRTRVPRFSPTQWLGKCMIAPKLANQSLNAACRLCDPSRKVAVPLDDNDSFVTGIMAIPPFCFLPSSTECGGRIPQCHRHFSLESRPRLIFGGYLANDGSCLSLETPLVDPTGVVYSPID